MFLITPEILTVNTLVSELKKMSGGVTIMSKKEIQKQIRSGALRAGECGNKYVIQKCDFLEFWNNTFITKTPHHNDYTSTRPEAIDMEIREALGLR